TLHTEAMVDGVGASAYVDDSSSASASIAGAIIAISAYAIIAGGAKRISNISAYLVPIMAGLYLFVGIIVVAMNIGAVPGMVATIFSDAFSTHSIASGALGSIMLLGVHRRLF